MTAPVLAAICAVLVLVVFGQLLFAEWASRGNTDRGTR